MSDADLLRRAAAEMRGLATESLGGEDLWWGDDGARPIDDMPECDFRYLTKWRPAVAFTVADWLDATARQPFTLDDGTFVFDNAAVRVARAYLGEPAEQVGG